MFRDAAAQPDTAGVPPELVLAAATPCTGNQAVRLRLPGGHYVTAVVGEESGDPALWWQAILDRSGGLIPAATITRAVLPAGLHADAAAPRGHLDMRVSRDLPPALQRRAVRTALRAATPAAGRQPAAVAAAPPGRLQQARIHALLAAAGAGITAAAAAVAIVAALPGVTAPPRPQPGTVVSGAPHHHGKRRRGRLIAPATERVQTTPGCGSLFDLCIPA